MAPITCTEDYFANLESLAEPIEVLEKHGFIFRQLNEEDLLLKRRCAGCGKTMSRLLRQRPPPSSANTPQDRKRIAQEATEAIQQLHVAPHEVTRANDPTVDSPEEPKLRCRYHLGSRVNRVWACCNQPAVATTEPCGGAHEHVPSDQHLRELAALYQCYPTPLAPPKRSDIRSAVAIDCEMGQAANGDPELIRVTLIDYFSQAILIDNLVEPDVPMAHLNTRYSGVTWADVKKARREKTILKGKSAARQAIWRHVGPDTVLVGHGLDNDLRSLRWIHTSVVDSFVTEFGRVKLKEEEEARVAEALKAAKGASKGTAAAQNDSNDMEILAHTDPNTAITGTKSDEIRPVRKPGNLSLKTLAKRNLGREIQMKGKAGHDSLEDAIAARDLVHWNVLELMGRQ